MRFYFEPIPDVGGYVAKDSLVDEEEQDAFQTTSVNKRMDAFHFVFDFGNRRTYWFFLGALALLLVTTPAVTIAVCFRRTAPVKRNYVSDSSNELL